MKNLKKYMISTILIMALAFMLPISLSVNTATVKAASMEINKSKATLEVGKTVTLKVNNLATTSRVKWTSSNKKIATVSTKGKVTAKGAGTAKITAAVTTKAGKTSKYTSAITVKEATIYFTKQDRIVIEDGKLRYTLTFDTENGYRLNTQKFDKSTGHYGYDGQKQYSYSQFDDIKMGDITFNAKKATLIMDNADIDFLRVEFSRELNIILKGENKITGTGLYYTYTTMSLKMYDPKAGFNFKGDGSLKIGHEKGIEIEENHPSRGLEIRDADHLNLQDSCTLDIVGYWCAIEYSDFVINVGKDSTLNLSISEDATSFQRHGIRGNYSSEGQRNKLIVNGTFCAEVPIFAGSEPGTVFYCGIHGKPDVNDTRIEVGDGNVIYAGETAETAAIVDASVYADNSPQVSYMRICAE